jgi:hypothetical protein
VNGKKVKPGQDGILRLAADFAGGTVVIETASQAPAIEEPPDHSGC